MELCKRFSDLPQLPGAHPWTHCGWQTVHKSQVKIPRQDPEGPGFPRSQIAHRMCNLQLTQPHPVPPVTRSLEMASKRRWFLFGNCLLEIIQGWEARAQAHTLSCCLKTGAQILLPAVGLGFSYRRASPCSHPHCCRGV